MTLLISALTIGLILSLLALGVLVSFRIFGMPDITADGSITLGAGLTAILCLQGVHPLWGTLAAFIAGLFAGAMTGILHTRFRIHALLSGILMMTALYSINLRIMGRSNVPVMDQTTLASIGEAVGIRLLGRESLQVLGWDVSVGDLSVLFFSFWLVAACAAVLLAFFRTRLGTAMRATGDNPQMMRALGGNVHFYIVLGLALSNGLIALSGALLAQYQGFADVQMGVGMIVWGLASVIIGEAITGERSLGLVLVGAIMGSVLFRLLVAVALRWGLNPNDLKLITAVFVFIALVSPRIIQKIKPRGSAPA